MDDLTSERPGLVGGFGGSWRRERLQVEVVADGKRDVLEWRLIRVALDALRIENQQLRDALAHVHGPLRAARTDLGVEEVS
ncbi:hypothetical protein [Frankia tisae]|uniref:hypothetical protein n=1 Tax=Frankia tisae TaxID=2950104 RepID=UPI0021C21A81|nr:hypothetical protein [Frankia tisae]